MIVLKLLVNLVDFRAQLELWCRAHEHYELQTVNWKYHWCARFEFFYFFILGNCRYFMDISLVQMPPNGELEITKLA